MHKRMASSCVTNKLKNGFKYWTQWLKLVKLNWLNGDLNARPTDFTSHTLNLPWINYRRGEASSLVVIPYPYANRALQRAYGKSWLKHKHKSQGLRLFGGIKLLCAMPSFYLMSLTWQEGWVTVRGSLCVNLLVLFVPQHKCILSYLIQFVLKKYWYLWPHKCAMPARDRDEYPHPLFPSFHWINPVWN